MILPTVPPASGQAAFPRTYVWEFTDAKNRKVCGMCTINDAEAKEAFKKQLQDAANRTGLTPTIVPLRSQTILEGRSIFMLGECPDHPGRSTDFFCGQCGKPMVPVAFVNTGDPAFHIR